MCIRDRLEPEPTTPKNERALSRAASQGSSNGVLSLAGSREASRDGSGEGNLFYAYAKRVCWDFGGGLRPMS